VLLSCTRHNVFDNAHVSAASVLHCLCKLRVLQTSSMCWSMQCGSGGTDSSSSISAGTRCVDCTHADVSCCVPCIFTCNPNAFGTCTL
jgi:hypothetical protein